MRYKIILILLLAICFSNCYNSPISSDIKIKKIKIYYVPFLITSHGSSTESHMREMDASYIKEKDKIKKELLKLSPIEDDFSETDVQLVCDFYNNKNKKEFTLLCDRFTIKINDRVYKNEKLIKLLTSD